MRSVLLVSLVLASVARAEKLPNTAELTLSGDPAKLVSGISAYLRRAARKRAVPPVEQYEGVKVGARTAPSLSRLGISLLALVRDSEPRR